MPEDYIRPDWLRSFVTVAESNSYEHAAEQLNTAQPTVWKQVNNLAKELGMPLFERGSVRPTMRGEQLLGKARQLLLMHEELREQAENLRRGVTGVVRVACYPAHVNRFLARAAGAYKKKYPRARVLLSEFSQAGTKGGEHLDRLENGEVDLAVGPRREAFDGIAIYESRLVVVLPEKHPRRRADLLGPQDLRDENLLVSPRNYFSRNEIDRSFQAAGIAPHIETESSSWMALLALGEHGVGVPIVPDDTLDQPHSDPYPGFRGAEGGPVTKETWLQWRHREELQGAVENFIRFVEQFLKTEDFSPGSMPVTSVSEVDPA